MGNSTLKNGPEIIVIFFFLGPMLEFQVGRYHKAYAPVVRSHATVYHADVFSNRFHFVDTLFIIQNGLLLLLRSQDDSISSCNETSVGLNLE